MHIIMHQSLHAFEQFEYKLTMKGMTKRLKHRPRQAEPITPQILLSFTRFLDLHDPIDATYWSLFLTAFFAMARKSNLVPSSKAKFDSSKQLTRGRVLLGEGCLLLVWSWAKNIQTGNRIHKLPMLEIVGSKLCPVKAFARMARLVPAGELEPAFCLPLGGSVVPVTYHQFNAKLKALIRRTGLDPSRFSTHSFRRGGATCAFKAQVPETLIQLQGDWASECYKRYLRMGIAEKKEVAQKMASYVLMAK